MYAWVCLLNSIHEQSNYTLISILMIYMFPNNPTTNMIIMLIHVINFDHNVQNTFLWTDIYLDKFLWIS